MHIPIDDLEQSRMPAGYAFRPTRIAIGPMSIDQLSSGELVRQLIGHALAEGATKHVVTANAQFYVLAEEQRNFRDYVAKADYVCADGVAVTFACRWLGKAGVARVPGVNLLELLCRHAAPLGLPVYFVGGQPGTAAISAEILQKRYPGLNIAGVDCPPMGFLNDPSAMVETLTKIENAKPAILFVGLGAPLQEKFIHEYVRPLGVSVAVGVGGSFELISGRKKRAPEWLQMSGCEWLFRWVQEPKRLAYRYSVGNILFTYYLVRHRLRRSYTAAIT